MTPTAPTAPTGPTLTPTVFIVDDDAAILDGLARLLASAGLEARTFSTASAFLEEPCPLGPACVLLDVRLPELSGFDVQEALSARGRNLPIIFLTGFGTIPMTVRAMKAGAAEFLTKPVEDDVLIDAVTAALARDAQTLETAAEDTELRARFASLTPREQQVMALVIGGLMNKQLAAELGTSEVTAKVHKRHVMDKMGARSLPDLVLVAERLDIAAVKRR
jgi:FixJ family two-component response regulator